MTVPKIAQILNRVLVRWLLVVLFFLIFVSTRTIQLTTAIIKTFLAVSSIISNGKLTQIFRLLLIGTLITYFKEHRLEVAETNQQRFIRQK